MEEPKIELSAKEFIILLKTGKATAKRGLIQIAEIKQVQNETVRYIHNIDVNEDLKIHSIEFNYRVHIVNCKFKNIWLEECNFIGGLTIESSTIKFDFGTKNTSIQVDFAILSTDISRYLNIVWGSVFENFLINNTNVMGNFSMNNGRVTNNFQISYSEFKNRFHFYNDCSIGGQFIIDHVTAIDINIDDLKVLKDFNVFHCEFNGTIDIKKSQLFALNLYKVNCVRIDVFKVNISERLIIQYDTISEFVFIMDTIIDGEFIINETSRKDFTINGCTINILSLSSISKGLSLNISNSYFTKIRMIGAINNGYMQWNNLIPQKNAVLEIQNTKMGNWNLVSCNFENVIMIVCNSKITDTFYTNTKFPKILTAPKKQINDTYNNTVVYEDLEDRHNILRDGYNQLKTIAQKQNDRGMFLHYQAAELRSYHETLKGDKNHRATRFQLWAMSISNNYGTSWWKGVKFVAGFNLLFVIICFGFRKPQFDCSGIGNFLNLYLSSLSLISTPKILNEHSNWEMNWFYISRIPLAFGIYQTIAAFRKFGKSE